MKVVRGLGSIVDILTVLMPISQHRAVYDALNIALDHTLTYQDDGGSWSGQIGAGLPLC